MVWCEVAVQLPLAAALLLGYARRARWLRPLGLLYAVHVATTMVPILAHLVATMEAPHLYCVLGFYSPWAAMPAVMLARFGAAQSPTLAAPRRASVRKSQ